jgi:hypothetical protein
MCLTAAMLSISLLLAVAVVGQPAAAAAVRVASE